MGIKIANIKLKNKETSIEVSFFVYTNDQRKELLQPTKNIIGHLVSLLYKTLLKTMLDTFTVFVRYSVECGLDIPLLRWGGDYF